MALRVRLQPLPVPVSASQSGEPQATTGLRVGLLRRGAGKSSAKRGAALPARLTFVATLFSHVRAPDPSSPQDIAALDGTIQLVQGSGLPVFNVLLGDDGALPLQLLEPLDGGTPGSPSPARRGLSLEFSAEQFPDVLAPAELLLPAGSQPTPPPPFSIAGINHTDLPNSRPAIGSIIGSIDGLF